MTGRAEAMAVRMGLDLPDFDRDGYCGAGCGTMKPCHRMGRRLFQSGHVAEDVRGRLGADLTVEQGHAAARACGANVRAGMRQAVGSLDRVVSILRRLNVVACTPGFTEVHKVSSGLLREAFGPERGLGGRATIGVMALAGGTCFETWATVEVED